MLDFGNASEVVATGLRMPRHTQRRRGNVKIKEKAIGTIRSYKRECRTDVKIKIMPYVRNM